MAADSRVLLGHSNKHKIIRSTYSGGTYNRLIVFRVGDFVFTGYNFALLKAHGTPSLERTVKLLLTPSPPETHLKPLKPPGTPPLKLL